MEELHVTRTYEPHSWTIVKLTEKDDVYFKVLGSWRGGYTQGDSWRFSSQIESIEDAGTHWVVRNRSGSVYVCGKKNVGMSSYTASVYSGYEKEAAESEDLGICISSVGECIGFLKEKNNV